MTPFERARPPWTPPRYVGTGGRMDAWSATAVRWLTRPRHQPDGLARADRARPHER